jgi:hypothetical protein
MRTTAGKNNCTAGKNCAAACGKSTKRGGMYKIFDLVYKIFEPPDFS